MSNSGDAFDAMVDWMDACRHGQLAELVGLYDYEATLDCCGGERFEGRAGLQRYWKPKLQNRLAGAFETDALTPEPAGGCVDYRDYDGQAVRTHSRFKSNGKSPDHGSVAEIACGGMPAAAKGDRDEDAGLSR